MRTSPLLSSEQRWQERFLPKNTELATSGWQADNSYSRGCERGTNTRTQSLHGMSAVSTLTQMHQCRLCWLYSDRKFLWGNDLTRQSDYGSKQFYPRTRRFYRIVFHDIGLISFLFYKWWWHRVYAAEFCVSWGKEKFSILRIYGNWCSWGEGKRVVFRGYLDTFRGSYDNKDFRWAGFRITCYVWQTWLPPSKSIKGDGNEDEYKSS